MLASGPFVSGQRGRPPIVRTNGVGPMQTESSIKTVELRVECQKPAGGYCVVSSLALYSAWLAYRGEIIELLDLRVWIACFELLARRCGSLRDRHPRYRLDELRTLVRGGTDRRLRAGLRRLQEAGLMHWREDGIDIVRTSLQSAPLGLLDGSALPEGLLDRPVPIPRRLLRFMVSSARPVLIATALAHVLRGAFLKNAKFVGGGRCKASWIADVFEVDVRNVKSARRLLMKDGWFVPIESSQAALNRWGAAYQFDFKRCFAAAVVTPQSPPRQATRVPESPPPILNKKLLIGSGTARNPAGRGPNGAYADSQIQKEPTMRNVMIEDLRSPLRLKGLFQDAVRRGFVQASKADELYVFAAAEHAKSNGATNPCGLFAWLVRQKRWNHINQLDEDRARATIARLHGSAPCPADRRHRAPSISNGSAPGAIRSGAPEAARQILAGTGLGAYPVLAAVSAALGLNGHSLCHGGMDPTTEGGCALSSEVIERKGRHSSKDREILAA